LCSGDNRVNGVLPCDIYPEDESPDYDYRTRGSEHAFCSIRVAQLTEADAQNAGAVCAFGVRVIQSPAFICG
jgi:hypothetical protein